MFDLDDTLYPERSFTFSGYRAVAAAFADRIGASFDLCSRMGELFDTPARGRVFDVVLAEAGVTDAAALVPEMIDAFRRHQPDIRLHPDADAALTRLRAGHRLGVISDGPLEMQSNKVGALGIGPRVDEVILTDRWGREFWKPHPRAFEQMATKLAVPPEQCVYVADNPAKDFVAPNALGWRTVFVKRPDGIYADRQAPPGGEAGAVIESLEALAAG